MYKVEIDKAKKFIKVELSGFVKLEEVDALSTDLTSNYFSQFSPKEPNILFKLTDFKPVSAKIGPALEKLRGQVVSYGNKMASVHSSAMAKQQVERIVEGAKNTTDYLRFDSEEEAVKYLFE